MAQTNWIEKAFLNPQDRFTVAITFPQGCRKIVPQGNNAGTDYISPVVFNIQIAYFNTPNTWVNLKDVDGVTEVPDIVVGADVPMKDGFTKSITYYAANNQFDSTKRFTVRIRRESRNASQTYMDAHKEYAYYYTSILQSITGYRNIKPAVDPKNTTLAKTAVSIVASKQLSGQIEGINAVVQTYCKDWNGTAWVLNSTSNPASLFRYVLTHPGNPQKILESEISERINLEKLQYWHNYCNTQRNVLDNDNILQTFKFEYNSVLGSQRSVLEVLKDICAAGRASPALVDGKWTVNIDEPKDVVQHFSPHNSWGFESVKALPKTPDGIKIQFFNELKEFQQDELIVYNEGFSEATAELFESITLPGITNPYLVQDTGKWHFAQLKLRPEIYTLNTDIEYLVCNRGDRVKVTHDVPMWGLGSGRIKTRVSSSVYELDEEVFINTNTNYTIRVRSASGGSAASAVKTSFSVSSYSVSQNIVTLNMATSGHPIVVGNTINVPILGIALTGASILNVTNTSISYKLIHSDTSSVVAVSGLVYLADGYYSTVQLQSDMSIEQANFSDLFLYGELNKESQDLVLLSIEPTSGAKNARLTFTDYGVTDTYNIFTDYQSLSSVTFESQISNVPNNLINAIGVNKPIITTASIISDESVMTIVSPGVFKYAVSVPFTNSDNLPTLIEWVEGEITRYYDNSQATASYLTVPITSASILFNDVVEGNKYKIRLRYITSDDRVGLWTDYVVNTVTGKSSPASKVTGLLTYISERALKFTWDACPDPDYAFTRIKGYIIKSDNSNNPPTLVDWNTASLLFEGTATTWSWVRPATNYYAILLKHVDTSGNESTLFTYRTQHYTQVDLTAINLELSNPSPLITNATDGVTPILTGSGTELKVYEGNTLLKYSSSSTANGYWNFTKVDQGLTSGSIIATGDYATVANLTSFTDSISGTITYNVTGTSSLGNPFALQKIQYFTRVLDGVSFVVEIESTNGNVFRVGQSTQTILKARVFRNGEEVTDNIPFSWFRWRRVSMLPRSAPNDDATWNSTYISGSKLILINVDDIYARASFFCDIVSP